MLKALADRRHLVEADDNAGLVYERVGRGWAGVPQTRHKQSPNSCTQTRPTSEAEQCAAALTSRLGSSDERHDLDAGREVVYNLGLIFNSCPFYFASTSDLNPSVLDRITLFERY